MSTIDENHTIPAPPVQEAETVVVGRVEDVPEGRGATVQLNSGRELALYNVGGEFFAVSNFCPHRGAPLADGHLIGHVVECDWHGWRFDVRTGECLTTECPIESYEVKVDEGVIKITV